MSFPLATDSWEKYTGPDKFKCPKSQEGKTVLHALPRHKFNQHQGSIVLDDSITKILVPNMNLLSLQDLNYLDLVRNIHQAHDGDPVSEAKMGRIWEAIVMNIYHFESESTKTRKLAEANSEEAKHCWSDYRLSLQQQRVRPVAADFFDVDPKPVDRENYNILSTTAGTCQEVLNRDMPMVDAGQLLANEEQAYRAKSEKPQELASQLSIWGGPPRSAEDETAVNSAPSPALGHRFRKTFGPVAFVDENGTVIDESNH